MGRSPTFCDRCICYFLRARFFSPARSVGPQNTRTERRRPKHLDHGNNERRRPRLPTVGGVDRDHSPQQERDHGYEGGALIVLADIIICARERRIHPIEYIGRTRIKYIVIGFRCTWMMMTTRRRSRSISDDGAVVLNFISAPLPPPLLPPCIFHLSSLIIHSPPPPLS